MYYEAIQIDSDNRVCAQAVFLAEPKAPWVVVDTRENGGSPEVETIKSGVYKKYVNGKFIDPEQSDIEALAYDKKAAAAIASRANAYRLESDPLYFEAIYDAGEGAPDLTAWKAKVAEIKARYPKQ